MFWQAFIGTFNSIPFKKARSLIGKEAIIGLSISNIEQVKRANFINLDYLGLDYLGVGPVFQTATKKDADPAIGPLLVVFR